MRTEKGKGLTGYKRIELSCEKCGNKIIVETDYLSETQAKSQHKCKKGKGEI